MLNITLNETNTNYNKPRTLVSLGHWKSMGWIINLVPHLRCLAHLGYYVSGYIHSMHGMPTFLKTSLTQQLIRCCTGLTQSGDSWHWIHLVNAECLKSGLDDSTFLDVPICKFLKYRQQLGYIGLSTRLCPPSNVMAFFSSYLDFILKLDACEVNDWQFL